MSSFGRVLNLLSDPSWCCVIYFSSSRISVEVNRGSRRRQNAASVFCTYDLLIEENLSFGRVLFILFEVVSLFRVLRNFCI